MFKFLSSLFFLGMGRITLVLFVSIFPLSLLMASLAFCLSVLASVLRMSNGSPLKFRSSLMSSVSLTLLQMLSSHLSITFSKCFSMQLPRRSSAWHKASAHCWQNITSSLACTSGFSCQPVPFHSFLWRT